MHTPVFHNCYLLSVICPGLLLCKDILLFLKQANPNETDCNNTGMPVSPSSHPHTPTPLYLLIFSAFMRSLQANENARTPLPLRCHIAREMLTYCHAPTRCIH